MRHPILMSLVLLAAPLAAQEPIATDRPDFVESSQVVGPSAFQIETSAAFEIRSGNELWYVGPALDFETGSALKVTVTATDNEGETADAELEVGIGDLLEPHPGCLGLARNLRTLGQFQAGPRICFSF